MKKMIVGNWKMHKTPRETAQYLETLAPLVEKSQASVWLAVPYTSLAAALAVKGDISIGAQNMHDVKEGAFTGEISALMLKGSGADFVLLGHSERRHLFQETSVFINRKIKRALEADLVPIVCIGETLEERERGEAYIVLEKQLNESLEGLTPTEIQKIILAYEPVWAIGTGKSAHSDDAEKAHCFCKEILVKKFGESVAVKIPILYGGSVNPENAESFLAREAIDGLLVGGASLSPTTFYEIITVAEIL